MALLQVSAQTNGREQEQSRLDEKVRRELGEAVLSALADHRTEDICLNPDGKGWANRQGDGWKSIGELAATQAHAPTGTIATQRGTGVSDHRPILVADLAIDVSRVEGLLPPGAARATLCIQLHL